MTGCSQRTEARLYKQLLTARSPSFRNLSVCDGQLRNDTTSTEVIDPRLWEQMGVKPLFQEPGRFLSGLQPLYYSSLGQLLTHPNRPAR